MCEDGEDVANTAYSPDAVNTIGVGLALSVE